MKTKIYIPILFLFLCSCGKTAKSTIIYLYSEDQQQVVTVISDYTKNKRIIAVGKQDSKPISNYIELDISSITDLGDELGICWNKNGHNWEMVNDKSKIIERKLDTTKYVFRENWFKDERDIPTTKYYREEHCFTVGTLNYSKNKPAKNGYVQRL